MYVVKENSISASLCPDEATTDADASQTAGMDIYINSATLKIGAIQQRRKFIISTIPS